MASAQPSPVTPADRLAFTLVAAILVHAVLVFGIKFVMPALKTAPTLEVTLVPAASATAPVRADFIAQADQIGSGTTAEARLLTTRERTPLPGQGEAPAAVAALPKAALEAAALRRVTTTAAAPDAVPRPQPEAAEKAAATVAADNLQTEIAALEARLSANRQAAARLPRVRTLAAVNTRANVWAGYLEGFRERVERIGNANYPAEARAQRLQGEVRLLVALLPDGRLQQVSILSSSGHRLLDQAALQSVREAQPYGHFPAAQQGEVDILQIVRTWRFAETLDTRQ